MRPGRWTSSRWTSRSRVQARPAGPAAPPGGEAGPGGAVGPYDLADAPSDGWSRVDLGSLVVPSPPGATVGVSGRRTARGEREAVAVVGLGQAELVLAAFAAPRSHPLWGALRAQLRTCPRAILAAAGLPATPPFGPVQETIGPCGPELRLITGTAGEPRLVRVFGFDGPRWLLRAVLTVPLETVPLEAVPLEPSPDGERIVAEVLRGVIVLRGGRAVPSGGALALVPAESPGGKDHAHVAAPAREGQADVLHDAVELDDRLGRIRPNGAIVGVARESTSRDVAERGPYLNRDLFTWS